MADLLIKGLETPKGDLALWIIVHKDGTVEYIDNNKYEGYTTLRNAAVTVPPHGRLIDADALADSFWDGQEYFTENIRRKIEMSKTIIPASEEVDNGQI